jgi:hypothetical protein
VTCASHAYASAENLMPEMHGRRQPVLDLRGAGREPGDRCGEAGTVIAEDGTAVVGVFIALGGICLRAVTGEGRWEAGASWTIGLLLLAVATAWACRRSAS